MRLDVDMSAVNSFTMKLKVLHKSAFPAAVMSTLNSAAFDVKTNEMQKSADKNFVKRAPTFFKANSSVKKADGFNVNQMKSTVGMMSHKLRGPNNYAVNDLEEQEHGGDISNKAFIPINTGRISNNSNRLVSKRNWLNTIGEMVDAREGKGKTRKGKFMNAFFNSQPGQYIKGEISNGKTIVWRINSISSKRKEKRLDLTPIYSLKKGRSIKVKGTHFMKTASLKSADKLNFFYKLAAQKQIDRLSKK